MTDEITVEESGDDPRVRAAKKLYPAEYVDPDDEPENEAAADSEQEKPFRNAREAAEALIDQRRAAERVAQDADDAVPEAVPEAAETRAEPAEKEAEPADGTWTDADLATFSSLMLSLTQFEQDASAFAEARQAATEKLKTADKGEAAALREQLRAAEAEMVHRYQQLTGAVQTLKGKAAERARARRAEAIKAEQAKLMRAIPDFDAPRLVSYLKGAGFSESELAELNDHRAAVIAEKARRYDEMMSGNRKKVVHRKRARPAPERPMRHRTAQGRLATIAELERRVKATGSVQDAVALLAARRKEQRT